MNIAYAPPVGNSTLPEHFSLGPNYPNPFNPTTTIHFDIAHASHVKLRIYDVSGRLVRTLVDETLPQAPHSVRWDGRAANGEYVATGVYFYQLIAGNFAETRKMLLLK